MSQNALVDLEIYSSNGTQVYQAWLDNQAFTANVTRTFQWTWAVPSNLPAGTYTIKVGIFTPNWGSNPHWNDGAATVVVTN